MVTQLRVPAPIGLSLLDEISRQIRPDDPSLVPWCQQYLATHRSRFGEDLALADAFTPFGSSILELGSVPPLVTAALIRTGRSVVGLDIAPERFQTCVDELSLDIRKCNFETEALPFPDGHFDAVMVNEVFEHLRINPLATMREVRRVLRPGGLLLLSTPNLSSARGYANFLAQGRCWSAGADPSTEYRKLETVGHMGHVREYTPREVSDFLCAVGFEVQAVIFRGVARTWWERIAVAVRPRFLPFVSVIAECGPGA